jgi:hypothetical protein
VSVTATHFQPSLIFDGKARAYNTGAPYETSPIPTNIGLGLTQVAVTSALAYNAAALITAVTSFIVWAIVSFKFEFNSVLMCEKF